ncbi:uncharacterized protein [Periplaneta americana]|uniref:uncharacterized protein n=1 Tax=Periplaneta americana TaxID=6978 RepID=UPI0037E79183
MEWDEEKCLQLIDVYKSCTTLWDQKDPNYYKKEVKKEAWNEVGAILGTTGASCKQKMVNLLASFRRERMKIRRSAKKEKNEMYHYKSSWFAFNALLFLLDREKTIEDLLAGKTVGDSSGEITVEDTQTSHSFIREVPKKKVKQEPKEEIILKDIVGIIKSATTRHTDEEECDEIKSFCNFIQQKMKKYTTHTKNLVQQEICQVVFRADQGFYEQNNSQSQTKNTPQESTTAST